MTLRAQEYDSARRKPRAVEELLDLLAHGALVRALVERDVKVRYKRSVFGFLWTMLNPAAMLLVVSLAFTNILRSRAPGYPFFVCPGILLWTFFAQTTMTTSREAAGGVDLWRRIRLPKTALFLATLLSGVLNLLLALVPLIVILALAHRPLGPALLTLPLTIVLASLFVFGTSLILAAIAVYFPDVADIYSVLLPALMFTAPVVYPSSIVSPSILPLLRLNPMTTYLEAFRAPLYANTAPTVGSFALMAGLAAVTVLTGWLLFTRSTDDIPYRL